MKKPGQSLAEATGRGQDETALAIREARLTDVPAIAAIFASDEVAGHGDTTAPEALPEYEAAFARIARSTDATVFVAELDGVVVATCQTVVLTTLTGRGATSLLVKAVHTRSDWRGQGVGAALMRHCITLAEELGAGSVQLTSNAARRDAHRFYERLGFRPSHRGYTMALKSD